MRTNLLNDLSNVLKKGTSLSEKGTSLNLLPKMDRECIENDSRMDRQSLGKIFRYAAMITLLLTLACGNVWGSIAFTVGVTGTGSSSSYGGSDYNKMKINAHFNWDNTPKGWLTEDMSKAGITFEGLDLYIKYLSYDDAIQTINMQFQKYKDDYQVWSWDANSSKQDGGYWNSRIVTYGGARYNQLTISSGAKFYFDASGWSQTAIKFVVGHTYNQSYSSMTNITGTKLYYLSISGYDWASGIGVVGGSSRSGSNDQWLTDVSANASEYSGWKNYSLSSTGSNNAYLMINNGKAGEEPTMYYFSNYTGLDGSSTLRFNNTQTYNTVVKEGSGSYTSANSKATINISSYELTSQGGTTNRKPSLSTSEKSKTVSACRTATTRLQVGTPATGYQFDGWYTAATGGSLVSNSSDYTYYPTGANTYYARFSAKSYTLTLDSEGGTGGSSSGTVYYNSTTVTGITNPEKDGYVFAGWYSGDNGTGTMVIDAYGHLQPNSSYTDASGHWTNTSNQKLYAGWLTIHTPGAYKDTYGKDLTIYSLGQYELYGISRSSSYSHITAGEKVNSSYNTSSANNVLQFNTTTLVRNAWAEGRHNSNSSVTSVNTGEFSTFSTSSSQAITMQNGQYILLCVNGYSQLNIIAKDYNTSDKYFRVEVNGVDVTKETYSSGASIRSYSLTSGSTQLIKITAMGGNTSQLFGFSLKVPCAAFTVDRGGQESGTYTVGGYDGNELTCTPSPSGTYTYQWKQYTQGQGVGDTINAVGSGANTNSFTPNPASAGTYYYMCRVLNVCGDKQVTSTTGTFVFNAAPSCSAPAAPTDISAGSITTTGATLTITDAGDAPSYDIYYSTSSTAPTGSTDATTTSDSKTKALTGLTAGTTYYVWVRSVCDEDNKSAWVALNPGGGTHTFTTNYTITYAANGGTGTMSVGSVAAGSNITLASNTYKKELFDFDGWKANVDVTINSSTVTAGTVIANGATLQSVASNVTLTAQWADAYAYGTYTFEDNASAGTNPNKLTMTDGSEVAVAAGSRVDNIFFGAMTIKYESGTYGGEGDDFKGWKIKTDGATIKLKVENDSYVTIGVGNLTSGAKVSYTEPDGTSKSNIALTAKTDNVYSVKAGTTLTFTTTGGSTVTLKKIAIEDIPACSPPAAPTISGTTAYTYGATITLTATCESGTDASTTYTWYKGADWATASAASPVQAASTSGATFSKTAAMSDAGTYWCEAANGSCKSHNSSGYAITVAKASISPSLSYSSLSLITGDNSSSPTITGNTGSGSVTYSVTASDPSGCITVNESTGVVTAVAAGTGTVTATIAATDNYLGGTATAIFTVTDPCFYANDLKKKDGGGDIAKDAEITASMLASGTITGGTLQNTSGATLNHNKSYGLVMESGKQVTLTLTSPKIFEAGTVITVKSYSSNQGASDKTDYNKYSGIIVGTHKLADSVKCTSNTPALFTQTYTVTTSDGIEGGNSVVFKRTTAKTYIYSIKVTGCGEVACSAPTSAVISGGGAKYQYDAIELTASASGTESGVTTYTWYRGNDGEDAAKEAGAIQATSTSGSTYTIAECSTTDAAVYYCVISNGTGCDVTASTSISVTAAYTLTYSANTDDPSVGNMPSQEIHTPGSYTLSSKVPTRNGYTFDGWYYYSNYTGTRWDAGASFTTGALNETLYAKWAEITHTVTISGGAHGTASPSSVTGVGIATASGNITATPSTGYTFNSWTLPDGVTAAAGKTSSSNPIQINATADGKTITATYTATEYSITYNLNGGSLDGSQKTSYTVEDDDYELPVPVKDDNVFVGWYDNSTFTGSSIEILEAGSTSNKTYWAKWGSDYTISWGNAQLSGVDATPNLGGGNYTITASVATWTGTLTTSMISTETSGVTITNVAVDNSSSPKTITATFNVGASVAGDEITFSLSVPAAGVYGAKESSTDIDIERCTGGSGSSVYKFQVKTGLGSSATNIDKSVTAATTENYLSSISGGTLPMHLSSNGNIQTIRDSALCLKSTSGYLTPTLSAGTLQRGDIVIYRSENKSMHMMCGTDYSATTDVILPKGNNMVAVSNSMHGRSNVSLTKNDGDVYLKYFEIMRPTSVLFFAEVNAGIGTGNIGSGTTETELTAGDVASGHILSHVSGGKLYTKARSAGYVKGATNEIQLTDGADGTYIKVAISDATLAAGDIIITNSTTTSYPFAITTSAKRSTKLVTSCYTIPVGSGMIGQSTIYLWKNSSSTNLRTIAVVRPGAGGVGVAPTLTWSSGLADKATVSKNTSDDDFTYTASQNTNSLGAITYTSSVPSVATVNASGNVHIVYAGEGVGSTVITATIAASGCYSETSISYTLNVTNSCSDEAGTLTAVDNGCEGVELTLSGYTEDVGATVIKWYKDGEWQDNASYNNKSQITVTAAGEWYAQTTAGGGTGHCPKSSNSVEVTARASVTASKLIDSWYVKKDRRTPDIELVQTTGAVGFFVKIGDTEIWNSDSTTTTGFAGCGFHIGDNGIIYLNGTKDNGDAPAKNDGTWAAGDVTLKITAKGCGGNSDELSITIHKQAATTRPSIAFVVDGTKDGNWDAVTSGHASGTDLYDFLDYTRSGGTGAFDLTERNIYKTTNEKTIREQYSQFDAILITDDPNTGTKDESDKSYVNAFGTMVDIRPILTMEAFVSKLANWKAKGIAGTPDSPNPRQYAIRLECKDHEIYGEGLPVPTDGTHVWEEIVGGETYRYVIMVDSTKGVYDGVAYNVETAGDKKPALQGFDGTAAGTLLGLGRIADGSLQAAIERQEEPAARLLVFGVNAKALRPTSALTTEGKIIIENILEYLLKTNMEEVDDCSNYFTGKTSTDWNTSTNWSKGSLPNYETKVRILAPCEVSGVTAHVAQVDIVSSGESSIRANATGLANCNGKLTINANGALIVEGKVRAADAPHFAANDLKPTTVNDLVLNTDDSGQAALIFNNDEGKTQATVNLYSLGRMVSETNQFQYFAIPMSYLSVNPTFANETHGITIYTYVWLEATGWERRGYYTDLYAFEGIGITTNETTAHEYTMKGTLASTKDQEIPITADGKKLNLIGNSWTAPIQISELEASDFGDASSAVEQTVYIYCAGHGKSTADGKTEAAGQWLAIPFEATRFDAWDGLKVIPSMQAFQIKTKGEGTLTLDYDKHVRGGSTDLTAKLRAPQRRAAHDGVDLMRIRVADSKTHTDLYLFEGDQFSDAFDNGWEANYRVGTNESAKLYARVATGVMSVAAMSDLEGTPIYFIPGQETEYTFTFGGNGMGYYLNDLKLQQSTLISEGAEYSFTYEKGDAAARFMISATPYESPQVTTGTENVQTEDKPRKILYNNKLYIIYNGHVYSADGAIVK